MAPNCPHADRPVLAHGLCASCYQKEWRNARPDYVREQNARLRRENPRGFKNRFIKAKYGITMDDYDALYNRQSGCCAICGSPQDVLQIDHATDEDGTIIIRGLLCGQCNRGLGMFYDSLDNLVAAHNYFLAVAESGSYVKAV